MIKKRISIAYILYFFVLNLTAQTSPVVVPNLPVIKPNIPTTPTNNIQNLYPNSPLHNPHSYQPDAATITNVQQRNIAIQREVAEHQQMLGEIQRQTDIQMLLKGGFPSLAHNEGTANYYNAFDEINNMLKGDTPLNIGRTIFLIENAYYDNAIDYNEYRSSIKGSADFCNQIIENEKLDKNDNLVKNMMIFRYMSDTLEIRDKTTKKKLFHYPVKYNLDDYDSHISFDSHFVTTLMRTGKGQCESMPLYYLTLAEEMGAEAYWSFSPRHSFVKIQDDKNNWYNVELTCQGILSDTHYMNNGFIKAEAIQNGLYLEPMEKKKAIAELLTHLMRGYYQKYGYDDFILKCADIVMQYSPNSVRALMFKADYETQLTLTLAHLLQAPKPDIMKEMLPEAYTHFEQMQALYKQMDDLGYEELPSDLYQRWLDHIAKEKAKADKLPSIFLKLRKE